MPNTSDRRTMIVMVVLVCLTIIGCTYYVVSYLDSEAKRLTKERNWKWNSQVETDRANRAAARY